MRYLLRNKYYPYAAASCCRKVALRDLFLFAKMQWDILFNSVDYTARPFGGNPISDE